MKNVVQCVNNMRARGLNHWQFKTFLEYLDCDYHDVVYFTDVCWFSRVQESSVENFEEVLESLTG